jgi:hypothetical protein
MWCDLLYGTSNGEDLVAGIFNRDRKRSSCQYIDVYWNASGS